MGFLAKHNEENPQKKMELVLFDDALKHLFRISRLLEMPRGSALLVGVGGSGKQSLTRLSSYISRAWCFQIVLIKTYNLGALDEDLRGLYRSAGHKRNQTTFLFTDSEIKDEMFLEKINTVLMTGNIPGLFPKDEVLAITGDLHEDLGILRVAVVVRWRAEQGPPRCEGEELLVISDCLIQHLDSLL